MTRSYVLASAPYTNRPITRDEIAQCVLRAETHVRSLRCRPANWLHAAWDSRLATAVLAPMSSGFEFDARRLTRSRVSVCTWSCLPALRFDRGSGEVFGGEEHRSTRRGKFMPGLCSVYVHSPLSAGPHTVPGGSASECRDRSPPRRVVLTPTRCAGRCTASDLLAASAPRPRSVCRTTYARLDCVARRHRALRERCSILNVVIPLYFFRFSFYLRFLRNVWKFKVHIQGNVGFDIIASFVVRLLP